MEDNIIEDLDNLNNVTSTADIVNYKRVKKEEASQWFTYKDNGNNDRITFANEDISISYPAVYDDKGLATYSGSCELICIFSIINHARKQYATVLATCKHNYNVIAINTFKIGNHDFKELLYSKGDIVMSSDYTVVDDSSIFVLFDLFYIQGKIPWFLGYEDIASLLGETRKYSGSSIGDNPIGPHILTSLIARDSKKPDIYYRELLRTEEDIKRLGKPAYKGLKDPLYSFNTTSSRLVGAYLEDGMITGILKPTTKDNINDQILTR